MDIDHPHIREALNQERPRRDPINDSFFSRQYRAIMWLRSLPNNAGKDALIEEKQHELKVDYDEGRLNMHERLGLHQILECARSDVRNLLKGIVDLGS